MFHRSLSHQYAPPGLVLGKVEAVTAHYWPVRPRDPSRCYLTPAYREALGGLGSRSRPEKQEFDVSALSWISCRDPDQVFGLMSLARFRRFQCCKSTRLARQAEMIGRSGLGSDTISLGKGLGTAKPTESSSGREKLRANVRAAWRGKHGLHKYSRTAAVRPHPTETDA